MAKSKGNLNFQSKKGTPGSVHKQTMKSRFAWNNLKIKSTPRLTKRNVMATTPKLEPNKVNAGGGAGAQETPRRLTRSNSGPDTTIGMSTIPSSHQSTPKNTSQVNGARKVILPEGVKPLTPRVLVRPYASKGFLDPPITIDETNSFQTVDLSVDGTPGQKKKSPRGKGATEKKRRQSIEVVAVLPPPTASTASDRTLEEGEILDNSQLGSPDVVVLRELADAQRGKRTNRSSDRPKQLLHISDGFGINNLIFHLNLPHFSSIAHASQSNSVIRPKKLIFLQHCYSYLIKQVSLTDQFWISPKDSC
jgi:hypothetical protein